MRAIIIAAAFATLAGCGQQPAEAPAEPVAPASLQAQVRAMDQGSQQVFAYQQLVAHLQTQGAVCTGPRGVEARGTVPENVAADSIYAPFAGADAYTVQCGEQLTTVRADPRERWLVIFAPEAAAVQVVNCANDRGVDQCAAREIPTATPTP